MRLPSIAQRGEGRAGGWEWGVEITARREPQSSAASKRNLNLCTDFNDEIGLHCLWIMRGKLSIR
jgi:hypothetical protein